MRLYFTFPFIIGLLGLSIFTNSCAKEACVKDGFIAQGDTLLTCSCGDFTLHALDTFRINTKGNCEIKTFKERKLSDWLDENEVIRIGMEPDAPPTFFTKGDKETGFDYELLKSIFPKVFEGIRMEVKGYKYDTLPQLLLQPNPQIEMIAGGYVADTTLRGIIWTKPYLTYGYALITREADQDKYKDLASLKGKKVGVYDDGVTEDWLKTNCLEVGAITKYVDNTETPLSDWMQVLIDGKVDVLVYDYPFAVQEIEDYDDVLVLANKRLNRPDDLRGYSFGIPAGNKKLLKKLNDAIEDAKKTPAFAQMIMDFIPDPDLGRAIAKEEVAESSANIKPIQTPANAASTKTLANAASPQKEKKVTPISAETLAKKKTAEAHTENYSGKTYTVQQGETLSVIAGKIMGDEDRWEELYLLNPHIVSPDIVYVGTILKVPKYGMIKKEEKKWGDKERENVIGDKE